MLLYVSSLYVQYTWQNTGTLIYVDYPEVFILLIVAHSMIYAALRGFNLS